MQLNSEQLLAVEHPLNEPACLIAGAGSGKTATMTARVKWLIAHGVKPRRIAVITFTNRAAGELVARIGVTDPHSPDSPRVSTIHSLALSAIRKNPLGFGLQERVSPLDDYDQSQMMKKIIEREKITDTNPYAVLEKIQFHRARGVGFVVDYTEEVAEEAERMYSGYHLMSDTDLKLWGLYQTEKTRTNVLDFDDMILLCNRRFATDEDWKRRIQAMWDHVLVDEVQDISKIQWQFIEGLLAPDNFNLFVVGDLNQCQPAGTKVKIVVSPHRGSRKAICERRPIETLHDGDLASTWCKGDQITYNAGRKIQIASRPYSGDLIKIETELGSTECTPGHWNWVRWNKNTVGKYLVYLMYRSDLGFRVGMSVFKRAATGGNRWAYGLTYRMNQEKADKGWILRICDTRPEAEAWEEIYSVKYGIPESLFESTVCWNKTDDLIKLVFQHANPNGGRLCLADHGLLEDAPVIIHHGMRGFCGKSWRGFFKTAAANTIPDLMDIPVEGRNKSVKISKISRRLYEGLVYSLDVEGEHTYIADDLVVGNSIYSFTGAAPYLLKQYSENWRGVVPRMYKIVRNHRSVPEIVRLANVIQSKMGEGSIPLKMESWRGENGESGKIEILKGVMASEIAADIAVEIFKDNEKFLRDERTRAEGGTPRESQAKPISYRENFILVRAAIQIRDIETELVRRRIPYVVRGGRGLLQTEEVRDVLAYMRLATNHKDFMAFVRAAQVPRRGCGEVALEKIRATANDKYDGDLIAAAEGDKNAKIASFGGIVRLVTQFSENPVAMLERTLALTQYTTYISDKYKKDSGKVKTKLENLDRFGSLIEGLVADGAMTAEDMIFQLTLDRPKDDDESGAVTISTIHSAKGLEAKRVYVNNVTEGSLPHKFSSGNEEEIREERRLFYVACTRARDYLILCIPVMLQQGPNVTNLRPSRFLIEIGVA